MSKLSKEVRSLLRDDRVGPIIKRQELEQVALNLMMSEPLFSARGYRRREAVVKRAEKQLNRQINN